MLEWETLKSEFLEDSSSLRDIYVFGATINDWQSLFDELKTIYHLQYTVDGEPQSMPDFIAEVFATKETASAAVSFDIGTITVISHFFTTEEIEFDILAREVDSQQTLDTLLGFLRLVGDKTQKRVILTNDGDEAHPILSYRTDQKPMFYHHKIT